VALKVRSLAVFSEPIPDYCHLATLADGSFVPQAGCSSEPGILTVIRTRAQINNKNQVDTTEAGVCEATHTFENSARRVGAGVLFSVVAFAGTNGRRESALCGAGAGAGAGGGGAGAGAGAGGGGADGGPRGVLRGGRGGVTPSAAAATAAAMLTVVAAVGAADEGAAVRSCVNDSDLPNGRSVACLGATRGGLAGGGAPPLPAPAGVRLIAFCDMDMPKAGGDDTVAVDAIGEAELVAAAAGAEARLLSRGERSGLATRTGRAGALRLGGVARL
jgi:hypothetical protein